MEVAISADDLLPLLSYVMIQAAPPHMESTLHMIEQFMPEALEKGEVGYYSVCGRIVVSSLMEAVQKGRSVDRSPRAKPDAANASGANSYGKKHKVQFSETLEGIAIAHGVRVAELARANGLALQVSLYPGQELMVPQPPPSAVDELLGMGSAPQHAQNSTQQVDEWWQ